ncbi:MAG: phosphoenolpyruvate synthase [Thermomicrobiales bacterium]|nr:phosphoenolpyruvate synthase [Thermomicrobiales bacterium]
MTGADEHEWVASLDTAAATRAEVGGKGVSLADLVAAGFPVPPGFAVTTAAYRRFVATSDLRAALATALAGIDAAKPAALETATAAIGRQFAAAPIPPAIAAAILHAYAAIGGPSQPVAVRSSATSEDLLENSFAGQQATFLNVSGDDALLDAVRRCWASLWTARASGYRHRMGVDADSAAMGVVVQTMIPADAAGVLFTANPITGDRGEMTIDAAFGLGEAVVSGLVTPETHVIDKANLRQMSFAPGGGEIAIVPTGGQGTVAQPIPTALRDERVLPDALREDLVRLGLRVERHAAGKPQDIEWAIADGKIWLLQARPIAALPPASMGDADWEPPEPGTIWIRRQVVEHMPAPLSTLFEDLYLGDALERSVDAVAAAMGLSDLFARLYARPYFATVNGYAYMRGNLDLNRQTIPALLRSLVAGPIWLFRYGVAAWRDEALPAYVATTGRQRQREPSVMSDAELLAGIHDLARADARYWFAAALAIGAAKLTDDLLDRFLMLAAPGRGLRASLFLRGFPSRALAAEAELEAMAARARTSEPVRAAIAAAPAARLLEALPDTPAGRALRDDIAAHLARYGHRIYSLDFAEPTLADAPLPVLVRLKRAVLDPDRGMEARRVAAARESDRLAEDAAASLDPLRRAVFLRLLDWARRYAPNREEALFFVGAAWPTLRGFAHELGRRLVAAGLLSTPDDVFFLAGAELDAAVAERTAGRRQVAFADLARERRALREARKRLHPPASSPPSSGFRLGPFDLAARESQRRNPAGAAVLHGFAVSAGRAVAPASVIRSPLEFDRMEPGTILVCPTTTPAWTPLLAQAGGLVTDIGGVLAHGSIVAREFGIPAVMGVGEATERIANGQTIAVDGDAGTVTLEAGALAT